MTGWFEIEIKPQASLLELTMGGFFDRATIEEMRTALACKLVELGCAPNEHLTLCNIVAMNIQSQDMVQEFTSLVGSPAVRSRRLAFVTGATLARLQARRLTNREGVAYFSDEAAAREWLSQPAAQAA